MADTAIQPWLAATDVINNLLADSLKAMEEMVGPPPSPEEAEAKDARQPTSDADRLSESLDNLTYKARKLAEQVERLKERF
jgi:hypothetical protein